LCGITTGCQTSHQHDNEGLFSFIITVSTMVQHYKELGIVWQHYRMSDISSIWQ